MSKYIIEIPDDVQYVLFNGKADNKYYTAVRPIAELEELNSDYINEHFGSLQDEAYKQGYADAEKIWRAPSSDNEFYQKGLEDGKKSTEKGCEGCKYESVKEGEPPCRACSKAYMNRYTPRTALDRIEVGDEVSTETGKKYTVVSFGAGGTVCGFNTEGKWTGWKPKEVTKTGKHYDIASILEAMRK